MERELFTLNYSARPPPLTPYTLKCDKEPLNSRLGPPDFHPQTPNCLEETLTGEYAQSGYKETIGGLEVLTVNQVIEYCSSFWKQDIRRLRSFKSFLREKEVKLNQRNANKETQTSVGKR